MHLATYAAAGLLVWRNRTVPGLWILAVGAAGCDTPEVPVDTPDVPPGVAFLPAPAGEALE